MNGVDPSLSSNRNFTVDSVNANDSKSELHEKVPEGVAQQESEPITSHNLIQCQDLLKINFKALLQKITSDSNPPPAA